MYDFICYLLSYLSSQCLDNCMFRLAISAMCGFSKSHTLELEQNYECHRDFAKLTYNPNI